MPKKGLDMSAAGVLKRFFEKSKKGDWYTVNELNNKYSCHNKGAIISALNAMHNRGYLDVQKNESNKIQYCRKHDSPLELAYHQFLYAIKPPKSVEVILR